MAMYFYLRLALSVKGEDKILLDHFQKGRPNVQKNDTKEKNML
jgi:hypothetical protein